MKLTGTKKRILRKRVLESARELYLYPQTDAAVRENLVQRYPGLSVSEVREAFRYLDDKKLARLIGDRGRQSICITPQGIDVLDGSLTVRGVETSNGKLTRLAYLKELRRGILLYCYSFHEFFNEDGEILAEFRQTGFTNLLLEEVRFHMWYLHGKALLQLRKPEIDGEVVFLARITARGMDVIDRNETETGVTHG